MFHQPIWTLQIHIINITLNRGNLMYKDLINPQFFWGASGLAYLINLRVEMDGGLSHQCNCVGYS